MGRYGKIVTKNVNSEGGSLLHQSLLFLLFFVSSFLILSVIVFYGPLRGTFQQTTESSLRYSAEEMESDISEVAPFSDLSEGQNGYMEAMYLKKLGVLKGYDDGTFMPSKTMNRAEFVKVMHEAKHVYPHNLRNSYCFNDVKNDWYAPFVCSAKVKGWVSGDSENFVPDREITLAEVVKIIMSISDVEVEKNEDGPWYDPYMLAATDMGWFDFAGISDVDPEREVTRAEVARLLYYPVRTGLIQ